MKKFTRQLTGLFVAYGALGLFTLALLDSALLPLPSLTDAGVFLLAAARPSLMPLYVASATIGSVIGCVMLYEISRRAGHRALRRFSEEKQARVKEQIDRYDVFSILLASVLPPPFPFKLIVITAGVLRFSRFRFIMAIAVGRVFRFGLEGYLAARYGDQAAEVFKHNYPLIGLTLAALLFVFFIARNLLKGRGQRSEARG